MLESQIEFAVHIYAVNFSAYTHKRTHEHRIKHTLSYDGSYVIAHTCARVSV